MHTSYFDNISQISFPVVSISGRAPDWYQGPQFKILAPKYWFFRKYKDGDFSKEDYTEAYYSEVLSKLSAKSVYEHLTSSYGNDITLLCYEKPNQFCHRRLVADWFMSELSLRVTEL